MKVPIRPFEMSDYEAALALWKSTEGMGLSAANEPGPMRAYLARNPGMSFEALDAHQVVGTILCGHDGRRGLIHHLATAQSHRGRGIGRDLVRHALGALREAGVDKCHLLVYRSNERGLEFWRKLGAECARRSRCFRSTFPTPGFILVRAIVPGSSNAALRSAAFGKNFQTTAAFSRNFLIAPR